MGIPWICIDSYYLHKYQLTFMVIHGRTWISIDIHGCPPISMDVQGCPCIPRTVFSCRVFGSLGFECSHFKTRPADPTSGHRGPPPIADPNRGISSMMPPQRRLLSVASLLQDAFPMIPVLGSLPCIAFFQDASSSSPRCVPNDDSSLAPSC